ncbi:AraC-like DNA-binding protein [Chitinophaga terrae (ex Kim and Jung 2007)]|uniref:helix-turn-helix domain-containing protein n=1 Tax=Chitinophaga terrae (ex Kim and Jung 2007) TaxID=408074 RepID=UPI0027818EF4|nr:AraC family transcriptional regulator [Chitinophaga terrae (ex Kim and Jung 2007)]MDQ0107358.1 AraC-like DNA-binding protein [Chitinophaga terrae (ex Kim and Jung 2007)]
MNQFLFKQDNGNELMLFPHILEMGVRKNLSVQLNAFPEIVATRFCVYYVIDGKFDWQVAGRRSIILPKDAVYVMPGEKIGGVNGTLDVGTVAWIHLDIDCLLDKGRNQGKWSGFSESEALTIEHIFRMHRAEHLPILNEVSRIFQDIYTELQQREVGYASMVNQLLDELIIVLVRQLTRQSASSRDFPKKFLQLEQMLRQNLAHQWTVEEMAASVGMGTTSFTERVRSYSGFSPLSYLINLRVTEATRLLKQPDLNVTDIALDTGFYSSQHFSTTFKKLTGYTPREFRKKNLYL